MRRIYGPVFEKTASGPAGRSLDCQSGNTSAGQQSILPKSYMIQLHLNQRRRPAVTEREVKWRRRVCLCSVRAREINHKPRYLAALRALTSRSASRRCASRRRASIDPLRCLSLKFPPLSSGWYINKTAAAPRFGNRRLREMVVGPHFFFFEFCLSPTLRPPQTHNRPTAREIPGTRLCTSCSGTRRVTAAPGVHKKHNIHTRARLMQHVHR